MITELGMLSLGKGTKDIFRSSLYKILNHFAPIFRPTFKLDNIAQITDSKFVPGDKVVVENVFYSNPKRQFLAGGGPNEHYNVGRISDGRDSFVVYGSTHYFGSALENLNGRKIKNMKLEMSPSGLWWIKAFNGFSISDISKTYSSVPNGVNFEI